MLYEHQSEIMNNKIRIAIGCDHGGFELKNLILRHLEDRNMEYSDFGCLEEKSCDYPDYAKAVADSVLRHDCGLGILICGTGIGMSMTANNIHGIRAALCCDCFSAQATREHNNANVLCLGARVIGSGLAVKIVDTFLDTDFSNDERHIRRISKIED